MTMPQHSSAKIPPTSAVYPAAFMKIRLTCTITGKTHRDRQIGSSGSRTILFSSLEVQLAMRILTFIENMDDPPFGFSRVNISYSPQFTSFTPIFPNDGIECLLWIENSILQSIEDCIMVIRLLPSMCTHRDCYLLICNILRYFSGNISDTRIFDIGDFADDLLS